MTLANLPAKRDMWWHRAGDWKISAPDDGKTNLEFSPCLQGVWVSHDEVGRSYHIGNDGQKAEAMAFQLPDRASAVAAERHIRTQIDRCALTAGDVGHRQRPTWHDVRTRVGHAGWTEIMRPVDGSHPGQDYGIFESYGVYRDGNRVGLVIMDVVGQDNNWDTEPGGPVGQLHPMIHNVKASVERLRA
ncbi:hypothetical protein [Arsenicicoccus sp. oral taxon 190]|uniref:hypothetical protein n=1 Tax=Arsenicicoccus sp. oral taxon 190 TaxID=1658671 RepID=UPI00067A2D45|nr:hypothetical protein [Arsenicicoccus sp. oral taxon 190]AKT52082.1 hypothetical protein ADJ73_13770 [Arsenicicoccus sp. oral taxon 190]